MSDDLKNLRPGKQTVAVGDGDFTLRAATMEQEIRLTEMMSEFDIGGMFGIFAKFLTGDALGSLFGAAHASKGKSDEEQAGAMLGGVSNIVEGLAGDAWPMIKKVFGHQLMPIIRDCVVMLLDTPANMKLLAMETRDDLVGEWDGKVWLGCPALRGHIRNEITFKQSAHIMRSTWALSGYMEGLQALLPLAQTMWARLATEAAEAPTAEE